MSLGAIVVIGAIGDPPTDRPANSMTLAGTAQQALLAEPLSCVEVVGRSVAQRTIERFLEAGVETVSVLVDADAISRKPSFQALFQNVTVHVVNDLCSAIGQTLSDYSQNGIDHSFICSANTYAETDLLDLFYFHRAARQTVTQAVDSASPLDLWVVDCAETQQTHIEILLRETLHCRASYLVSQYAIRLTHPRDLRSLAADILHGHCERGPSGREMRPGVWIGEGAEVHRRARVVAPAYIGYGSKVLEDALVTRFSSIERDCYVDCGTVIENSSILANTRIGLWLDICGAVVQGNRMLSLGRDVMIEVSDPDMMRSTLPSRLGSSGAGMRDAARGIAADLPHQHLNPDLNPVQAVWQFGASLYSSLSEE